MAHRSWERIEDGLLRFHDSCEVYALVTGRETTVINAGTGAWLETLDELPYPAVRLLLTHHFRDHSAGAVQASARGIEIWAPYWERELISDPLGHFSRRETYIIYDNGWDLFAPIEPIPVTRWMYDWEKVSLGDVTLRVIPTPGQSTGAVSYQVTRSGSTGVFAGEIIHSAGRIKRVAPLQYNYNDLSGAVNLLYSLDQIRRSRPDWIASSTGANLITRPQEATDVLAENLRFALRTRGVPEWEQQTAVEDGLNEITPHLVQTRLGNASTYFLVSEDGAALAIDFGYRMNIGCGGGYPFPRNRRPILHGLEPLQEQFGIAAPEAVLVTHFHDDHVNGIPMLARLYGTRCMASETFAHLLADPAGHAFPCTWPEPIAVEPLTNGTVHRWHEYEFSLHPMSGHTRFSTMVSLVVDGERVVATGDQYFFQDQDTPGTGPAAHNHVYRNGAWLSSLAESQELLERLAPTIILPGHGNGYRVPAELTQWTRKYAETYEEIHTRLMPLAEDQTHMEVDSRPGWLTPYRTTLPRPNPIRYTVTVRNPYPHEANLDLRLVVPDGWTGSDAEVTLAGRTEGSVTLVATPPDGARCRRRPIAVELSAGGERFGQIAEALVTIGCDQF